MIQFGIPLMPIQVGICLIPVGWGSLLLEVGPEGLLANSGVQSETLVLEIGGRLKSTTSPIETGCYGNDCWKQCPGLTGWDPCFLCPSGSPSRADMVQLHRIVWLAGVRARCLLGLLYYLLAGSRPSKAGHLSLRVLGVMLSFTELKPSFLITRFFEF